MSSEGLQELVLNAVKGLNNGEAKEFNSLIIELNKKTLNGDLFCRYLHALRKSIQHMNKHHETLIGVILNIDWAAYELDTVNLFIEFLGELISAKAYYVKVCIRSLIKQFVPRTEVFDDLLVALKRKCDHIHTALQTIVNIAPLSSKYIAETVKVLFPYTGKDLFVLETYIVNILQLTVYIVDTRYEILLLLIDKLMTIDVHITRHELEQESNNISQFQFDFQENNGNIPYNVNAFKLDQLVTILFAYIDSVSFIDNALDYDHAEILMKDLVRIYESVLLKTRSSHVQFLLFYVASFHKNFRELFIEGCWKILQDPNYASILRQTSAYYLSSFLSRAKYIEKNVIKEQMKRLSEWIHRYIDYQDDSNIRADKNRHGPFYSACQALFYVFIYHYKMLLETSNDIRCIKSLNFIRIVTSRLNPLKFCLVSVVNIFARITRMYEIVFCYSVIERNNRNKLEQQNFISEEANIRHDRIGMFFPFDPYNLTKSCKWIDPLYIKWNEAVHDEESDDEGDEEDRENSDLEVDDTENIGITPSSFDMICISPGFQFINPS